MSLVSKFTAVRPPGAAFAVSPAGRYIGRALRECDTSKRCNSGGGTFPSILQPSPARASQQLARQAPSGRSCSCFLGAVLLTLPSSARASARRSSEGGPEGLEYLVFGLHHDGDGAIQPIEEFWP
jgi:hypothetical protein